MSSISWNEVRDRALRFALEWADATDEEPDKQTFWNEFFEVFGVPRKSVATFEKAVAKDAGGYGFVDLFWRGVLLVEHNSAGQKLIKAEAQAFDYIAELTRKGLHDQVPRYVILSDFQTFVLFDLEAGRERRSDVCKDVLYFLRKASIIRGGTYLFGADTHDGKPIMHESSGLEAAPPTATASSRTYTSYLLFNSVLGKLLPISLNATFKIREHLGGYRLMIH